MVRDIFGDDGSDESDGEFEGFGGDVATVEDDAPKEQENDDDNRGDEDEVLSQSSSSDGEEEPDKQIQEKKKVIQNASGSDDESDNDPEQNERSGIVYDFDLMMQRRKEINSRKRRKKNIDIINDSDDVIAELIHEMKQAAEEDFELNRNHKAAIRKLKLLPVVDAQLKKIDLREALLDSGILGVITDWLTRLPDGSLPHLQIREKLLKFLVDFNIDDIDRIKASGVGKAVMYLFKHPKETRENKKIASKLISHWSRPIFNLDTDFHSITREEREQRDFEIMSNFKRRQSDAGEGPSPKVAKTDERALKPGEKGWVPRARVPMPSMKDYVVRPKSKIEIDMTRGSSKKTISRFEKHLRNFNEMKKMNKANSAMPISIEGRKMAL
ncbi:Transcription factor iws1 [Tyrophagus putrescentiae]|nr:Transcription factor iws1 [Tyrophagus putrescentiae]